MIGVEVHNLTKNIRGKTVLKNISLIMSPGRIYGFQGINGSGKTMLMRCILGLIKPTEGEVLIDGMRLGPEMEFPPSVGFLLENPAFLDRYTGLENLKMLASIQRRASTEDVMEALRRVGLDTDAAVMKYRKYSLGMKQRLGIAAAVMEKPDMILLDEPTNALDEDGIRQVIRIIHEERERGALIIVSCHDRYLLESLTDEIIVISNGEIVSGAHENRDVKNETA